MESSHAGREMFHVEHLRRGIRFHREWRLQPCSVVHERVALSTMTPKLATPGPDIAVLTRAQPGLIL